MIWVNGMLRKSYRRKKNTLNDNASITSVFENMAKRSQHHYLLLILSNSLMSLDLSVSKESYRFTLAISTAKTASYKISTAPFNK